MVIPATSLHSIDLFFFLPVYPEGMRPHSLVLFPEYTQSERSIIGPAISQLDAWLSAYILVKRNYTTHGQEGFTTPVNIIAVLDRTSDM